MSNTTHAGEYNRRVELFKYGKQPSSTGERVKPEVSLGKRWVKRIDLSGNEEEDGKLIPLSVLRYRMRFERDVLENGETYFFRDEDGDYRVNSVMPVGRNRELELKCSSRGKE